MITLLAVASALAGSSTMWSCETKNPITDLVVDTDGHQTLHNLNNDGWEPTPLLSGSFYANEEGCATASFSVHTLSGFTLDGLAVGDDYAVFRVELDGAPMYGHISGCKDDAGNFTHCLIAAHGIDDATRLDAHSYEFTTPITRGWHRVEVYYAGYDTTGSIERGAYVGGAVLSVDHP